MTTKRRVGPSVRMPRAAYWGHRSAAVKPGVAVARYSEWADTTSSSSRARTASTDLPSRSARRSILKLCLALNLTPGDLLSDFTAASMKKLHFD